MYVKNLVKLVDVETGFRLNLLRIRERAPSTRTVGRREVLGGRRYPAGQDENK